MNVLIVDDHRLLAEGLAALLRDQAGIAQVHTASDGRTALAAAQEHRPDVVMMDIAMPGMDGFTATRQLAGPDGPGCRVLIVSMHQDPEFVTEAFRHGAAGYVLKSATPEELLEALHAVHRGGTHVSPSIAGTVVERARDRDRPDDPHPPVARYTLLSPRERQTLQLLAEGKSVKEIAYELQLSDKTVHAFRVNLMHKLGLDNLADLVKFAIRHGLTRLD